MKYQRLKLVVVQRMLKALSSTPLFWIIVGLLVVQAAWIAATGLYPMAFDEDFHFGIIKIYAHHFSPFWSSQPESANTFGAVFRDPSYLYHYLMSFPFRIISYFTSDQTVQVLWLRAINIGLFAWGLVLFRKVLLTTGASKALIHSCFLVFILIPVMPLLAAQINYDNLLFPLSAAVLWQAVNIATELKNHRTISIKRLLILASLALLTSIVKYAFLPILLTIVVYLGVRVIQTYDTWSDLRLGLERNWSQSSKVHLGLLIVGLILSLGLFSQRYVVNTVLYHTPIPDCSKVLDVEACSDYGPWIRDYNLKQIKSGSDTNPVLFTGEWAYGMWLRLFFAVDGPSTQNQTRGPLLLPAVTSIAVAVLGIILMTTYSLRLWRGQNSEPVRLFAIISVVYVGVLWIDQYRAYLRTGQPVAINGRYLLPVLLPLLLLTAMSYRQWLKNHTDYKLLLIMVTIIGLAWGGGALTYILRSNSDWYWPNSTVRQINQSVQNTIGPIVPGNYYQGQFVF